MTAMIVPFAGAAERTARQNLTAFIAHAKTHRWFEASPTAIDWSANTWDIRPFIATRGHKPGLTLHFTRLESTRRGYRAADAVDFSQPFLDAAKALIVEHMRTSRETTPARFLGALRYIEKSFRDLGLKPDICRLRPEVLDRAAELLRDTMKDTWTYGRYLERIALHYVNQGRLSDCHLLWKSPFRYQGARRNDRVNKEGGAGDTADKLPHLKCVLDLAGVFHSSDYIPDRVVTAWFALGMFAPSRVMEILTLPLKCETEMDGVYGLGWRPLKGGAPMTKFSTSDEWTEVAREAIRRLTHLGAKARLAAKWYEENPGELYLPPGFEHLRGQDLTRWEISKILGKSRSLTRGSNVDKMLKMTSRLTRDPARLESGSGIGWAHLWNWQSVERYVRSALPSEFPYADRKHGLKVSEALFCLPLHIMRGDSDTQEHVPSLISYSQIKHELGSKPDGKTIAARHGLIDPDTGQFWKLQTHQPRHLLNTLAQSKHLSQALIAFWSGRKKIEQNAWYDHLPQEAFIEAFVRMGEQAPRKIRVIGPLDDKVAERSRKEIISYDDALRLELGSTISTRYGLCRHNYALTPCPKDKNCISCGENTFIKGDQRHLTEARKQLEINRKAVRACKTALAEGEPGVKRWMHKHLDKEKRWRMAVQRLTDDSIADGTLITLPAPERTQTKAGLAAEIRAVETDNTPRDFFLEDGL